MPWPYEHGTNMYQLGSLRIWGGGGGFLHGCGRKSWPTSQAEPLGAPDDGVAAATCLESRCKIEVQDLMRHSANPSGLRPKNMGKWPT